MTVREVPPTGYVESGSGRIYYDTRGSGPPIVLVHAGIADHRMWESQIEALSAEHRLVLLDLRGFGRTTTTRPEAFYDWEDVSAVCGALSLTPAVVVGASMGARVAVELALQRPDHVRGLVLVAPGLFFPDEPRSESLSAGWEAMEQAFDAGEPERAREIELKMWVDGPRRGPEQVDEKIRKKVDEMNARAYELESSADGRQSLVPPATERLGEIQVPVLVLVGTEDQPDILVIADRLVNEIAGARKEEIRNTAHMLNMEQPELFNEALLGFVREIEAG